MDEKNIFTRLIFNAEYENFESQCKSYGITGVKLSTGNWCRTLCLDANHNYVEFSIPPSWSMNFSKEEEKIFLDEIHNWDIAAHEAEESDKYFSFESFPNYSFWCSDGITIVKTTWNIWISEDFNTETLKKLGFEETPELACFSLKKALIDVSPIVRFISIRERTFYIPEEK